jgi:hypothetical protein
MVLTGEKDNYTLIINVIASPHPAADTSGKKEG